MPERRRAGRWVAGILGCAGVLAAVVMGVRYGFPGARRAGVESTAPAIDERSSLAELAEAARASDPRALVALQRRIATAPDALRTACPESEVGGWLAVLEGLRSGFLGYKPAGRPLALDLACRIFDRFSIEPAPARWSEALPKLYDLLGASLGDSDSSLRVLALEQVGKMWVWLPGRSLTPIEETSLVQWKEQIYRPVVRCLGHRDPRTIIAAVACLGALPLDDAALPAMAYLDNPIKEVRKQTIDSFERRGLLLTDDMLLTRLHDAEPMIRKAAVRVLKARGLSQEQISLGALIFSPDAQQRLSIIPLLKDRTDIDPALWLIQLSRDREEMVRGAAVEAMARLSSVAARRRLADMARTDPSDAVRTLAARLAPPARQSTAALPPLPGSSSLNPKAN